MFAKFFAESLTSGGALTVTSIGGDVIGSSRFHGFDATRGEAGPSSPGRAGVGRPTVR
ncbi:hypothetical protein [Micromonospora sp. NPDC093277]|uniref:hypothetical protein n=1 Tax=Micromonospora sp. NPDC093277 TaxID=3364291 RepID=UPI0038222C79